jgi:hypothetical protein
MKCKLATWEYLVDVSLLRMTSIDDVGSIIHVLIDYNSNISVVSTTLAFIKS